MGALPNWCEPLLDAPRMRAVDRWAIEERGIPSLDLMERAGEGVAAAVQEAAHDGPLAIVCGKGNNGGDGLVVARLLRLARRAVTVICMASPDELSPDARANLDRLPGEQPLELGDPAARETLEQAVLIVDALLGTGFSGVPHGAMAQAIETVNAAGKRVLSVDVPSGVDASTGTVAGTAIQAGLTVTFHVAKPGLWINPGKAHAGALTTIDIGIPRGAPPTTDIGLIGDGALEALPSRTPRSTKFTSGHVVVVGGSRGLTGAPAMAALASMRAGAGYVTVCLPESLRPILDAQLMEAMTRGLPDEHGSLTPEGLPLALDSLERAGAFALGPGLGRDHRTQSFVRELARGAPLATVLDADGLNAHAGYLADLAHREAPTVLTPHAGELARLLDTDSEHVQSERLSHARAAAETAQSVVILKGDDTLVVDSSGRRLAISRGHSPALATAGTGDVLTGIVAALLAQGMEPFAASAAGVHLHAEAGREAARRQGSPEGVIATDVIAALPLARIPVSRRRQRRLGAQTEERTTLKDGARGTRRS